MLEIPESLTMAGQLNETVKGKRIVEVEAAHTPHSFAKSSFAFSSKH